MAPDVRPAAGPRAPRPFPVPVVDLHCHNFNGEDIPLAAFLSGKFHELPPWFMDASGPVVAKLAHIGAPSAACERRMLADRGVCPAQGLADEAIEIAKWLLGASVEYLVDKLGFPDPAPSELDLARRFLVDIQSDTIERADPEVARWRELFAARGNRFSAADRVLQLTQLVGLGLILEAHGAVVKVGGLVLSGAKALSPGELRDLVSSARRPHLAEFEKLYGAALDRQIERDTAEREERGLDLGRRLTGELTRWSKRLAEAGLGALPLEQLARAGKRMLALLWSQSRGFASFVVNFFRFRNELSRDIATTYSRVDLFTPLLVDFSYWTGTAEQPRSRLADQIAVQRQLALTALESAPPWPGGLQARRRTDGGRGRFRIGAPLLPFIAFNPLREVLSPSAAAHRPGRPLAELEGALDLVRAAVLEHGFIGVKLYPPVGFAPVGNERHRRWQDGRLERLDRNLPPRELAQWRRKKRELGKHLDRALRALYHFCQDESVPILAHSNDSNSFQPGYGWCSGPTHWRQVLAEFPRLRLCLAHFGQFTGVDSHGDPAAAAATRGCFGQMTSYAWSYQASRLFTHEHVYVDLSNSEAATDESARRRLVALLPKLDAHSKGKLRERLIYGSDWFMNNLNGPHERFFDNLESAFRAVWSDRDTVAAVMGGNALRFLGLAAGPDGSIPANLDRVRRHYGARLPAWLRAT
jgi:predicted TIM-barrel fold metal-dependent hydrolase